MKFKAHLMKIGLVTATVLAVGVGTMSLLEGSESIVQASVGPKPAYDLAYDKCITKGLKINLASAVLVDYESGEVLYAKNPDSIRPIASISKLVAAMVIIDKGLDMSMTQTISREDAFHSSKSRLAVGYKLTLKDLLYAGLLVSDNRAIRALARAVSGDYDSFAAEMNAKVKALGLQNTQFYDPTGLDARNVSTAHEVALIIYHSSKYKTITDITSLSSYPARILNRKRTFRILRNTNDLVKSKQYDVLAGKTGYIRASAYCLATLVANNRGDKLTLVVLGAPGEKLRFREARKMADWGFKQLKTLSTRG